MNKTNLKQCIDLCLLCAATCNSCAYECLKEEQVNMMSKCIRLDMECAIICNAAASLMSIGSWKAAEICKIFAFICEACAAECLRHKSEHCIACADICTACSIECKKMAA